MAASFDVIVIGAGPAGEVAAGRIAKRSKLGVALIERELVGGECSFYACMPSKALLRPRELLREIERVPGVAEQAGQEGIDVELALRRRDEVIHGLSDESQMSWLDERGITLLRGQARLSGERRVLLDGETYEARRAVILATGSSAALPPIPGLAESRPWTNREATTAQRPPKRLIVLGGGPVGCEMAQAWRSLGSEVVLVEAQPRLLPGEEPFAGQELAEALIADGVDVRLETKATAVSRESDGIHVSFDRTAEAVADELLVAVGRSPHTEDLGLESIGLTPGKTIEVEQTLRVPGHPWLYAVGDVNGRVLLTHVGKYQARIAADNVIGDGSLSIQVDGRRSPRVTFTEPQVAAVGHTLAAAEQEGIAARAVDLKTAGTAGASFHGRNAPGTTRFVVDTEHQRLVGATFVGAETAELLHAATIAIVAEVSLSTLAQAIPAFPTRSELWLQLTEAVGL
ncbi:MAG TPA: NAD(P)/FAD-dependent oxidoreductase [Solirubrobacteraceae bacterium]|jgi:dihydrolipoamide dehydrogenase